MIKLRIHSSDRAQCPDLPAAIEWEPSARDLRQVVHNHGQTLQQLSDRGGLGWAELAAVLLGRRWTGMPAREAHALCAAELAQRAMSDLPLLAVIAEAT